MRYDDLSELRATEFSRLDAGGHVYLDYTGSGLYPASLVRRHAEWMQGVVLGNPHSKNPSSQAATDHVEAARARILEYFDADPDEYEVVFTCNACPYAKGWESRIVELGNSYAGKGIGMIAINSNDPKVVADDGYDQMVTRAKERGMKFPYVGDGTQEVAKAFGAARTPEVFLFDAKGTLVYHGAVDDNVESAEKVTKSYLKDALDSVVAGSSSSTSPSNCAHEIAKGARAPPASADRRREIQRSIIETSPWDSWLLVISTVRAPPRSVLHHSPRQLLAPM
jgi:hypothetical protein